MSNNDNELSKQPSAEQNTIVLKNREAVAVYIAVQNTLHDAIHAGIISSREAVTLLMVAGQDTADLLTKGSIELRGHDGQRIYLASEDGLAVDKLLGSLEQIANEAQSLTSFDGTKIANYTPDKKVVN